MDLNDIVISGISGRFPRSNNMKEFAYNLYNKIDMVDEDESRWKHFIHNVPKRFGKIRNLEKFDASFFSTLNKHANWTDPQMRILLEHAYEAVLDAGISPQSLTGSRTGVFIASSASEAKDVFTHHIPAKDGYIILGNANFYLSNRLSYALGLCGPSFTVDAACSSSAYALDCAFHYMESGLCDAALVGGSQLILTNGLEEYTKLGVLALDGISRPFDENASGFVRAETICVLFLQKLKDSKRVYANLVYSSSNNDGFKKEGTSFPSRIVQKKLMEDFYTKIHVDPTKINFIEAHSTGTRLGDPEEVASIFEVFSKNRNRSKELIIGSVKSNMGHSEAASGMSSIAKILIAFENQKFPPNINLINPRSDIEAFATGRIKVATEIEELKGEYIAMNSFGLGGANAHALFRANTNVKHNYGIPEDKLGRMVLWSGRTENAINAIFDDITERPLDAEHIALLQNTQINTTGSNTYRGYGLFVNDTIANKAVCIKRNVQYFNGTRRPIVFVYSGIGSQWTEMGRDLMKIPLFAESIDKCHSILLDKGINLKQIITSTDKVTFSNIMHSYIGIVAIEIALTDILKALGIIPDFIIGHSVGEICCAYADNTLTAEETMFAAFARGEASCQSKTIIGAMAAVGLHHKKLEEMLPDDIDIACHNAEDSTTISGPVVSVNKIVDELKNEKLFAKPVASSGIALHSRYIMEMGNKLNEKLKTIIKDPKERSDKWLSSTYSEDLWNEEEACFSSAEYHTNNLLNPVLFHEVTKKLPTNSFTIEIAPHGLLKAILKRNLKSGVYACLTQRDCKDGVEFFMESLGRLFQHGIDMDISKLYPPINFPVSRGTAMISPVIKWNHDIDHFVPYYDSYNTFERSNMIINISDKNFEFMQGNVNDGQYYFSESGWIVLVWEIFSKMTGEYFENVKVVFEDLHFLRSSPIAKNQDILITVAIHRGSGRFEVIEENEAIVNGYIKKVEDIELTDIAVTEIDDSIIMTEDDFYKEMRVKGYFHTGKFRGVKEIRHDGLVGKIKWTYLWHTFIDSMLQVNQKRSKAMTRLTNIRKMIIDPIQHHKMLNEKWKTIQESQEILFDITVCPYLHISQAGGVEIHDKITTIVDRNRQKNPIVEVHKFIPFFSEKKFSIIDAAKIITQTAVVDIAQTKFSFIEVDSDEKQPLSEFFAEALRQNPHVVSDVTLVTSKDNLKLENVLISKEKLSSFYGIDIILASNCIGNEKFFEVADAVLNIKGFVISRENQDYSEIQNENIQLVAKIHTDNDEIFHLLEIKHDSKNFHIEAIIEITPAVSEWLEPLKIAVRKGQTIVYAYNQEPSGLLGFVNCIRREFSIDRLKCFFIMDIENAPSKFDINHPFYKSQFDLNHAINIFKDGKWGSYRHIDMSFEKELQRQNKYCFASYLVKSELSSLTWLNGPNNVTCSDDVMINIHYTAINENDIELINGNNSVEYNEVPNSHKKLGYEFSGIKNNSERVMGIAKVSGALATHYNEENSILWSIPETWSLEAAATIPLAYFTVYFAYFNIAKIQKGKTILIHSGNSCLGQAAIEIALYYGMDVLTTVSSNENKNLLIERFQNLEPENILNLKNYAKFAIKYTKGKGVDYVFNTLSHDNLYTSIGCLAENGIFLEARGHDLSKFDMKFVNKQLSIKTIGFNDLIEDSLENKTVHELFDRDLASGIIKPLNTKVFTPNQLEEAFIYLLNEQKTIKILLKIRQHENDESSLPLATTKIIYFDSYESIIVAGGLGGFGLEMTEWLVSRGCKNLVLSSSRGLKNAYQRQKVKSLKAHGVNVHISTSDIASETGCEKLIKQAIDLGPVAAIFNLAAVLRDGIFENLDLKMFDESLAPKAQATLNLDKLSRKHCPKLRHFVVFSSISSARGYAGKGNYGLANSIMERIIEKRHEHGLPGKAIEWGAIGDVGMLEDFQLKNLDDLYIGGMYPQTFISSMEIFDALLTADPPIVSSFVLADKHIDDLKKRNIVDIIFNIMGTKDKKSVSMNSTFTQLGIDSLMGVEIQQVLEREYDVILKSQEIRSMTINQLETRISMRNSNNTRNVDDLGVNGAAHVEKIESTEFLIEDMIDLESFDASKVILKANKIETHKNTKLLILSGFFGFATKSYRNLAKEMEYPAYILQLAETFDCQNLDDIIEKLMPSIIELFIDVKRFILIGDYFGGLLSLKLSKILENLGKSGQIIQLDCSPQFTTRFARKIMNQGQYKDMKKHISMLLLEYYQPHVDSKSNLQKNDILEARIRQLMSSNGRTLSNYKYLINNIPSAFTNRLNISLNLKNTSFSPLESTKIALIKPKECSIKGIHRDYGLSQYSSNNVQIKLIDGDHITMMKNSELPFIVKSLICMN